jgi:putative alpha-1,2-mannosidase
MIGLYPLTGQTTFLVLSPRFPQLTLNLGNGRKLTVITTFSDGGNSTTAPYVQSLSVNGEAWDRAWVAWEDVFENGGTMEYVMGRSPSFWATGKLPPSPAST